METTPVVSTGALRVDTQFGKFSQACTVVLTAVAFLFSQPIIVLITAIILVLSALVPAISPYRLLYRGIVMPLHLLRPRIVEDDPAPHRFAQGGGAIFLIASRLVLFLTTATGVGWTLDLILPAPSGIHR